MLNTKSLLTGREKPAGVTDRPTLGAVSQPHPAARQTTAGNGARPVSDAVKSMSSVTSNADYESWSDWNPASFERVIAQYETRIYRFIHSMVGETELAHDLTQDTFLSAYRNLCRRADEAGLSESDDPEAWNRWQQIQAQNNMSAWLYTIARNAALSEIRRRKVVRFLPFLQKPTVGSDEEYDTLADHTQPEPGGDLEARTALHDELQQAMDKVGRDKLTALLLHLDGFSYKEICDITGDSLSSVKSQIFRAKDSLRRALGSLAQSTLPTQNPREG